MSDYIDIRSELCESCIHTNVCGKDKNLVGDVFVMGHPAFFDNDELFRKFKEREAAGFPCDDYMQERKRGKWIGGELGHCSCCGHEGCASDIWNDGKIAFCPSCGAEMESADDV